MLIGHNICSFVRNGQMRYEMENYILSKSLIVDTFYVRFNDFDVRYIGLELATYEEI